MNTVVTKFLKWSIFVGLAFGLFGTGVLFGSAINASYFSGSNPTGTTFAVDGKIDSTLLSKVKETLDQKFISWKASTTKPTDKDFEYGMIRGYVEALKDPYTVFMPPVAAKTFTENVKGSFGGVGMNVGMRDGNIVVIAPLKDSPAMKAGILAGDIIAKVNGTSTIGISSDEAVNMIRGEIGKPVTITVLHPNAKETTDITIVREEIKIPTIDTETKDGVFVIHLYNFSAESPQLFQEALNKFLESKVNRLVIDVRGNPGGYLDASVSMASFFLPQGALVVAEKQGQKELEVNHRSAGYSGLPKDIKVVVLVDGGSASASEILAGALKDHGVAKVVGVKTFGKGSVQEMVNFEDGSALKVTIAKWYTPAGVSISLHGITPDVEAVATTTVKDKKGVLVDTQLQKAIEVVKAMK
ncbi:MAG: carboxyl-terminal processing protease [Patescibacteria group bacterium]|nr:carboxyl-terminal processing protease [Patescibacteria group bacterium]